MTISNRTKVFDAFVEHVHELHRILVLSRDGMNHLASSVRLAEAVSNLNRIDDPSIDVKKEEARLEEIRARAKFASEEINRGYPVLHAHAVVALWGSLENLIFNLVIAWFRDKPALLTDDRIASLKISFSEFLQLDEDERLTYLVAEISRKLKVEFQAGVSRFESLLDLVGMSGPVSEEVRKALFEMFHIRNVLVHRAGFVDKRFSSNCPWRTEKVGTRIMLTHIDYDRFRKSLETYVVELLTRDLISQGRSREDAMRYLTKD